MYILVNQNKYNTLIIGMTFIFPTCISIRLVIVYITLFCLPVLLYSIRSFQALILVWGGGVVWGEFLGKRNQFWSRLSSFREEGG